MRLKRIVSGGQTGAAQAGWRAARARRIPTDGWMPLGFLTEDGPRPEFAGLYGAVELPTVDDPTRTRRNAMEASATIWFGSLASAEASVTHRACLDFGRFCYDVVEDRDRPSDVVRWLAASRVSSLNVAGNSESSNPGIGERVERFLAAVFLQLTVGG
jgi:hypothetical protein